MRNREAVAMTVLKFVATTVNPDDVVVGDTTAAELAALAASVLAQCPKCQATAWVNIDCDLCLVVTALLAGEML